jgi:DNA-binding transcriptional LysR family regulator
MPRRLPLSLELLETFLCLIRHDGDAAAAAKQLGINQPSMSKRLKSLQHAGSPLKHPWLERVGKSWKLTPEGERVLPAVRDLLDRHRQLTEFVSSRDRDQVRLACGQRATAGIVARALLQFRQENEDVPVRLSTLRGRERIERVATGSLDFALVSHDPAQILEIARRPLHVEVLFAEPLMLAAARESPWAARIRRFRRADVDAGLVGALPLILPEPDSGLRRHLDEWFETSEPGADRRGDGSEIPEEQGAGTWPRVVLETGGWSTILEFIRLGLGVGFLPGEFARGMKDLETCELEERIVPRAATRLICRLSPRPDEELDLTPPARRFRDILKQLAETKRPATA